MVWVLGIILVLVDQITKILVRKSWALGQGIPVFPSWFNLIHVENRGAAWSFLAEHTWGIWVLSLLSIVVSGFLIYLMVRAKNRVNRVLLAVIAAGGIGNMIDRILRQGVTDFFCVNFGSYSFPSFNFADIFITCGFVALFLHLLICRDAMSDFNMEKNCDKNG